MGPSPKSGAAESAATTETGRLGRYQLLQKLASGGMASVYLARAAGAAGFEKVIALKRIHPHLAGEKSFVDMFLDEARIASRIDHANVCSVFDFGEADGTYYIAMEFLAGEPLSQIAKHMARSTEQLKSPQRPYILARLVADACEGLHAAHELRGRDGELLNVVHRDISPQNLFVTYGGVVKVVDFGIASAGDRLHHTQGSEVKGKFSYMAPEQARGTRGAKLDRRADVFALGIVLWELLALKRLFRRDTPAETLLALINDPIPTPSSQRPGLPPDLDAITMKALARNPDDRYPTARELGRDLARAIGKAGEVLGAVDLADWLDALAPGARELSRRQIEGALQGDPQRTSLAPAGEVSGSDIVAVDARDVSEAPVEELIEVPAEPSSAHARISDMDEDLATLANFSIGAPPPGGPSVHGVPGSSGGPVALPALGLSPRITPPPPRRTSTIPSLARPLPSDAAQATGTFSAQPAQPTGSFAAQPAPGLRPLAVVGAVALLAIVIGVALAVGVSFGQRGAIEASPAASSAPMASPLPQAAVVPSAVVPSAVVPAPVAPVLPAPAVAPAPQSAGASRRAPSPRRPGAAPRADEASAPAAAGTLIVTTPGGWANVFDRAGRLLGQTPLRVQLPAGTHALSLRPFGQPPAVAVSAVVTAGGTARVTRPVEE